jgi:hypothetical protein
MMKALMDAAQWNASIEESIVPGISGRGEG